MLKKDTDMFIVLIRRPCSRFHKNVLNNSYKALNYMNEWTLFFTVKVAISSLFKVSRVDPQLRLSTTVGSYFEKFSK